MRRLWSPVVIGACVLSVAAGCGSSRPGLTVFAAASLTRPLQTASHDFGEARLTYDFGGSQQLVAQLEAGAPADVVATADQTTMGQLVAAGLVEAPVVFARNRLEIAVAPGNPRQIRGLADLARPGLRVVLAAASVPAGRYGRQALDRAGVVVHPVSLELDVTSVLAKVVLGEADAAIVYVTDVQGAGAKVAGVAIPDAANVTATYPAAVVRSSRHRRQAEAFIASLAGGAGQQALRAAGFLGP